MCKATPLQHNGVNVTPESVLQFKEGGLLKCKDRYVMNKLSLDLGYPFYLHDGHIYIAGEEIAKIASQEDVFQAALPMCKAKVGLAAKSIPIYCNCCSMNQRIQDTMDYDAIADSAPESLTQDRWAEGIDHHPMSDALMAFLAKHDYKDYKDYFCWKVGDNGETLKYQMDPFFEWLDRQRAKKKLDASYTIDGEVAVVYRPAYGIGWSSQDSHDHERSRFLAMNGQLARLVEAKNWSAVETLVASRYPNMYLGTIENLRISWIKKGTTFEIGEHDGYERIEIKGQDYFHAA